MPSFEVTPIGIVRNNRTDVQNTDNWGAHPYRGRSDLPPVGIFAGRGPRRPNRIGVTCCAIESVHGRELTVVGLDAVSGTPVIDLKPAMAEFHPADIEQPAWVSSMMSEYFQP